MRRLLSVLAGTAAFVTAVALPAGAQGATQGAAPSRPALGRLASSAAMTALGGSR